ncbi:hypothetical protein sphantq_01150 [Sphingobium sp. AntQ-1]|nr:hypothetical protein [Sphingobium sp. AntQ-1]WCP12747.1 hypothetical protein sphantq_01150 [Sphingobium sp. AntQ-1]
MVPESVRRARSHDVAYRELVEPVTSPIIMSHRFGDHSPEMAVLTEVVVRNYAGWGYETPTAIHDLE